MANLPKDIDPRWARLREVTPARIGLARTGSAIATRDHLAFQLDHARARDAVTEALDPVALLHSIHERHLDAVELHSAAADRHTFLARPDLGRRLDDRSLDLLGRLARGYDLVFALADGLSARAVMTHALPLIDETVPHLSSRGWRIGPVAIVVQGRVAVGDEIGQALDAALVAVLIGERPGLTSPDSLGVYLTWEPKIGRSDAERNCLSNIRPKGMPYREAAARLVYLCTEAKRCRCTGTTLKDQSQTGILLK